MSHAGVFYIYENFLKSFSPYPNMGIQPYGIKSERENTILLLSSWNGKEVNSYGAIFIPL